MKEVEFRDIRTSQYVLVEQEVFGLGPYLHATATWVGKVSETNNKWLKVKHDKMEKIVAQQGNETFYVLDKKEYQDFCKEFKKTHNIGAK